MKYIHLNTIFFILLLSSVNLFGQDSYVQEDQLDEEYVLDKDSLKFKDKLHYNFTFGAGFGYSSNVGDFFSTYYKPSITYDVSSRFSLTTGLTYVNSSVNNYPVQSDYYYHFFTGNISQYYAFVEGNYKVNEKLTVGGSVFYDFTEYQDVNGKNYSIGNDYSKLGYSAHFEYKLAKGVSVQGEIRMNDRSPFRNSFMGRAEHSFFNR